MQHFKSLHQMDVERASWEPVGSPDGPIVRLAVDMRRDSEAQAGEEGRTEIESFMYGPGLQVTRLSGKLRVITSYSIHYTKLYEVLETDVAPDDAALAVDHEARDQVRDGSVRLS